MFQLNASLEPKCERDQECAGWVTNSDVVHAVSKTPHGPYRAALLWGRAGGFGERRAASTVRETVCAGALPSLA